MGCGGGGGGRRGLDGRDGGSSDDSCRGDGGGMEVVATVEGWGGGEGELMVKEGMVWMGFRFLAGQLFCIL